MTGNQIHLGTANLNAADPDDSLPRYTVLKRVAPIRRWGKVFLESLPFARSPARLTLFIDREFSTVSKDPRLQDSMYHNFPTDCVNSTPEALPVFFCFSLNRGAGPFRVIV